MRLARLVHPKLLALSAVALFALAGCSGDSGAASSEQSDTGSSSAGGDAVSLVAVDNDFEPTDLEVPAGQEVTVEFTNDGEAPHTFTSEELGVDTGTIDSGESKTVTFMAPESDTEFVCTIHAESDDMVGTIGVK
ncbi:MAG: cupredoxin domain-containing protein [Actinomycetota bacterium]|nr:cupredoxin domain-containing protein [Actinomycetota bacterium]